MSTVVSSLTKQNPPQSPIPGLHIVANFSVGEQRLLFDFADFKHFIDERIKCYNLSRIGEVYHNFPGGGFTGVVCLTESHLSIHTWPELHYLTFDIFLSNFMRDNRAVTQAIYHDVQKYFQGTVLFEQIINR